jgi:hypothetical protein
MQFLLRHKTQCLEFHRDLSKIQYAPQTEAALQNLKTLLLLEISLLMGCDIKWAYPVAPADLSPSTDPMAVLSAGSPHADADDSDTGNNG